MEILCLVLTYGGHRDALPLLTKMEVGAAILCRVLPKMEEGAYGVYCALSANFNMLMSFVSSQATKKSPRSCERGSAVEALGITSITSVFFP
jgi:hypothetical protein